MAKRFLVLLGLIAAFQFALIVLTPSTVQAATAANCAAESQSFFGFPTWYKYLDPQFEAGECNINFRIPDDLAKYC
jgi:hypothetical protein